MPSVHTVAKYIVDKLGPVSAMKLQKLVYYSQAWSLVWEERPLFDSKIEAWAAGPVVPELYDLHRGKFIVDEWPRGEGESLNKDDQETIDAVCKYYGDRTAQQLSDLTHSEKPWIDARRGIPDGERSSSVISTASMHEYYSSI